MITLKHTLASALFATGLTAPGAFADSPLTEAFADYLGYCWSSPLNDLPVAEIQCFERLENHSVRRLHSVMGPHGMHYGEEILHWDSESDRIVTRYYNNLGGVVNSDGAIVDGAPVLFAYNDSGDVLQLRVHWGAVTGDQATFVREQYLGEDYGGWNTEEPRTFTRMGPASDFDDGPGSRYWRGSTVEAFEPLINSCWWASFDDTDQVDIHCFNSLFGVHVRDRHIVAGDPDYTGETLFHSDPEGHLHFRYFNSIGGVSDGSGMLGEDDIVFGEETYTGPDGETRIFRGRYSNISFDGYHSVTEELIDGDWVVVADLQFTQADHNPFEPLPVPPPMPPAE